MSAPVPGPQRRADPMGVWVGHGDAFGRRLTLPEIRDLLRLVDAGFWFFLVARLDRALCLRERETAVQIGLVHRLFIPEDRAAVFTAIARMGGPGVLAFHGHQLRLLLRLVLTTDDIRSPEEPGDFPSSISVGRVLLAVSDHLADPRAPGGRVHLHRALGRELLVDVFLREADAQDRSLSFGQAALQRHLLVELPRELDADLAARSEAAMTEALGLSPEEFYALGWAFLSGSFQADPFAESPTLFIPDPIVWLRNSAIPEERKRRFLELTSTTYEQARVAASTSDVTRFVYDFGWLETAPIIRVRENGWIVPDLEMLFRRFTRGLYPLAMARARVTGLAGAGELIKERRSAASEEFVRRRLKAAVKGRGALLERRDYKPARGERKEAGDAVAFDSGSGVLIVAEVKSGSVPRQQRRTGGADELFSRGSHLDRALITLSRVVAAIHDAPASNYPLAEIGAQSASKIVPLIVIDEPFHHSALLGVRLDAEARSRGLRATSKVTLVGIVSFSEMLLVASPELLAAGGAARMLVEWLTDRDASSLSLTGYLYSSGRRDLAPEPWFTDALERDDGLVRRSLLLRDDSTTPPST